MKKIIAILSAAAFLAPLFAQETISLGVLQLNDLRAAKLREAGIEYTVLEVIWGRFEPSPGVIDEVYAAEVRRRMESRRKAGFKLCLDLGIQYPPGWALELPNGKYINQYGDTYVERKSGHLTANAVFSRAVRERLEHYVTEVRKAFGSDFALIRLGWGHYGELNFPKHKFNGKTNCYWGFDAAAQGKAPELLAEGLRTCPVPGYLPGQPSPNGEAAQFIEWYLESLRNYHDWQLTLMRELYPESGLGMMYPSWGLRPGQIGKAVAVNLDGSTPAERNGELQRGFDFERLVGGIKDPNAVVYCTWIDSSPAFGNDDSPNRDQWGPAHYLSCLAGEHPLKLKVWGENTGGGGMEALELTAARATRYGFKVVLWAFEHHLFSGKGPNLGQLTAEFAK